MRLIDATALKNELFKAVRESQANDMDTITRGLNTAIGILNSAPSIDLVRCAECLWARPRTLKGETGYRCVFYRVDKAESGYCDCGEREGE